MNRLTNKRALITGGTSGIGLETARQFLDEGARVVVTGSSEASVAAAQREFGDRALVLRADAGSVADQAPLARAIGDAFGGLDAVFVNAGIAQLRPIEQWDEAPSIASSRST
jgi:NAD(P)-dependent dehydrogenase (short-subunit alcohol dehydrogenase family)